jgi:hypothetical protein
VLDALENGFWYENEIFTRNKEQFLLRRFLLLQPIHFILNLSCLYLSWKKNKEAMVASCKGNHEIGKS